MLVIPILAMLIASRFSDGLAGQSLEVIRSDHVAARFLLGGQQRVQAEISGGDWHVTDSGTYRLTEGKLCLTLEKSGVQCWTWPKHLTAGQTVTVSGLDGDAVQARFTLRPGHSAQMPFPGWRVAGP